MKIKLLFVFFTIGIINGFSQEVVTEKKLKHRLSDIFKKEMENPVAFFEIFTGIVDNSTEGFKLGLALNYQFNKRNLVSYRYLNMKNNDQVYAFVPIDNEKINEHGLLFGQRFVFKNISLSASAGVSFSGLKREIKENYSYDAAYVDNEHYWGIPYEVNIKLFKSKKRPFTPARLLSYKKPVAFGTSLGVKVFGSISQRKYIGIGMVVGFGSHKAYETN